MGILFSKPAVDAKAFATALVDAKLDVNLAHALSNCLANNNFELLKELSAKVVCDNTINIEAKSVIMEYCSSCFNKNSLIKYKSTGSTGGWLSIISWLFFASHKF